MIAPHIRDGQFSHQEYTMTMSLEKVLYTGKAHTTGGRNGASRSSDGRLDIKLSSPGTPGNGTNPEHAAYWGRDSSRRKLDRRLDTRRGGYGLTAYKGEEHE